MNKAILDIPVLQLSLSFIPVLVVFYFYYRWKLKPFSLAYATSRMIAQLVMIGFLLVFIFKSSGLIIIAPVLIFMMLVASWISLRPVSELRKQFYVYTLFSLFAGCVPTLALIVFGIIRIDPWYLPTYLIPLAGMVFANSMNVMSLAIERFHKEHKRGAEVQQAKREALRASLIPLTNSYLAVGLVSLPGMMTGQILAGVNPLIAVRYQILIMAVIFGSAGISAIIILSLISKKVLSKESV